MRLRSAKERVQGPSEVADTFENGQSIPPWARETLPPYQCARQRGGGCGAQWDFASLVRLLSFRFERVAFSSYGRAAVSHFVLSVLFFPPPSLSPSSLVVSLSSSFPLLLFLSSPRSLDRDGTKKQSRRYLSTKTLFKKKKKKNLLFSFGFCPFFLTFSFILFRDVNAYPWPFFGKSIVKQIKR